MDQVNFRSDCLSPSEVKWKDGPGLQALRVGVGVSSNDLAHEVGAADELGGAVGVFDGVIVGAIPLRMPRGFGAVQFAPSAGLKDAVLRVSAGSGPRRAYSCSLKRGGTFPIRFWLRRDWQTV